MKLPTHLKFTFVACVFASCTVFTVTSLQAQILLTANDAGGTSSFNTAGNWDSGQAPQAGNDYETNGFILKTPDDNGDYTFAGDSLTVNSRMDLVGSGLITINDLILDGGNILANPSSVRLAGNLEILSSSSIFATRTDYKISSNISGSATLQISGWQQNNFPGYRVRFSSSESTFTGNIHVSDGHLLLEENSRMNFNIYGNGLNNQIYGFSSGGGSNQYSAATFEGDFYFDLSLASSTIGDSWTVVNVFDQAFGETFNVVGFANSGTTWTSGNYLFDEGTGTLSVIPEPSALGIVLFSGMALLLFRRRRS
ncbi:PEP-CTERM sorting domain-containing protein [Puniceicoccus vermicola]|uniref:PEP-CTERM sorting domain-containing protein n=1 Tax=Puniceicoccus vermicola TaxID=388746 RepID=A0A7X1E5K2_9BACT|nr:PEP-CTERM sorting domain-containing protein [Puniceicoccus vermicola]MBC2603229.1 PEP-CTERM sorting domain-containing protein [Puniceicoccus vermicola]